MDQVNILKGYGLFDAKVPRYTSFPPANRFEPGIGARYRNKWLEAVPADEPISIYIHIPFCKRLCWFCTCRTQGTKSLGHVAAYIETLLREIDTVASALLPKRPKMKRLHLGGGTPTLLSAALMDRLLGYVHARFEASKGFEFSVEIDPTDAAPDVLKVLSDWNMMRASIGVQDFDPRVQEAIGRQQSVALTRDVVDRLRRNGVKSVNLDLLYGLPYQTEESLTRTLDDVVALSPDRLALYGYAHVPHVSKRQVMIPSEALPSPEQRFLMAERAKWQFVEKGFVALGIDHFARKSDGLALAAKSGSMRRNFQGYTDDPCVTLLGFGASAISKFSQGYVQNAVATSAYNARIAATGNAGHKGVALSAHDQFVAHLIEAILCRGEIKFETVAQQFPEHMEELSGIVQDIITTYPKAISLSPDRLQLRQDLIILARCIAARIDHQRNAAHIYSLAV
ncbi:MAG: oxygen-independent coproporphyrinogen III oxidase [Pseudomonadota bacterium]